MRHYLSLFLACSSLAPSVMVAQTETKTPIKHLVVIFQENISFDHYFGTYPHAENKRGEPRFTAKENTPSVNGLSKGVIKRNRNYAKPFRLFGTQADPNNPNHKYTILQQSCHAGLMDRFLQTSGTTCTPPKIVMGYFDGNTVTALWNYAQFFAMSDNFRTTVIAASTVGAINLISGQTHGALPTSLTDKSVPIVVDATLINDIDPLYDRCSATVGRVALTGKNIGDLLNAKGVTWGWFQGGFADCGKTHIGPMGPVLDYVPHHNPFQFYASTSNPQHLPPSSTKAIGKTDQANHLYDLADFWDAAKAGNIPSVSFLKARAFENGHGGNSNPLLEQQFLVTTINKLQKLPQWKNMAIIIAYDDSGGWYDHEVPTIINQSHTSADAFVRPGSAGPRRTLGGYEGRPGYGLRVPFLLISPWARSNFVYHELLDQTSILRFIEDNWHLGRIGDFSFDEFASDITPLFDFKKRKFRQLILNKKTGRVVNK